MLRIQAKSKEKKAVVDEQTLKGEVVGFVWDGGGTLAVVRCADNKLRTFPLQDCTVI